MPSPSGRNADSVGRPPLDLSLRPLCASDGAAPCGERRSEEENEGRFGATSAAFLGFGQRLPYTTRHERIYRLIATERPSVLPCGHASPSPKMGFAEYGQTGPRASACRRTSRTRSPDTPGSACTRATPSRRTPRSAKRSRGRSRRCSLRSGQVTRCRSVRSHVRNSASASPGDVMEMESIEPKFVS